MQDKIDLMVEQYPEVWKTRSQVFTWIKGIIRAGWNKAPQKLILIKKLRKQIPNPNPKGKKETVWGATCSICEKDFPLSSIQVDHKADETAHLTQLLDIQSCAEKLLLVLEEDLRLVCKDCHSIHSYSQKHKLTFEEAQFEKEVIKYKKLSAQEQQDYLTNVCLIDIMPSNAKARAEAFRNYLKEK